MNAIEWFEVWTLTSFTLMVFTAIAAYDGDMFILGLYCCMAVISGIMWFASLREVTK